MRQLCQKLNRKASCELRHQNAKRITEVTLQRDTIAALMTPLGIPELDSEHEWQHQIVQDLYSASVMRPLDRDRITQLLHDLFVEAERHFASEEEYMRLHKFPHAEIHADEHPHLLGALSSVEQLHRAGEIPADQEMIGFIWDWFNSHVEGSDRDLADFFRSR